MDLKVKKLYKDSIIPTKGTKHSAGIDLYAHLDTDSIEIKPGESVMIGTGMSYEIPEGYFGGLFARSGLGCKMNLRPANCVGVIDSDFRGELVVALYNDASEVRVITNNERVAQLVIMPYLDVNLVPVDELEDTSQIHEGFGSTGRK